MLVRLWFSGCGIGCRCLACRAQGLGFRIRLTSEWLDARNARTLLKPSHAAGGASSADGYCLLRLLSWHPKNHSPKATSV